jgi:RimJ/RimL family protein N-acetyltransferase
MQEIPRIRIETRTRSGAVLAIREMSLSDIYGVYRCIKDQRFSMPFLTGASGSARNPVRPIIRAIYYVIVLAMLSRVFGRYLFGARRHWLLSIEDGTRGPFIGVVLVDAVVRFDPATDPKAHSRYVERHKNNQDSAVGDGELGFFLHPSVWRQGVGTQARYALMAALVNTPSWCAVDGGPVLRRVWAETGQTNFAARSLLERLGLVIRDEMTIPADQSPRFNRDGTRVVLVHYAQSANDQRAEPTIPLKALIDRIERAGIVNPYWRVESRNFVG